QLQPGAPFGAVLTVTSSEAADGRVGFRVALPNGQPMPSGPRTVIEVSVRARPVEGKQQTSISVCDAPVARQLVDALGRILTPGFNNPSVLVIGSCSVAESVDALALNWTNSAIGWSCQTNVTHDG